VVDAAVSLQSRGHRVVMYTSHHDPSHCFVETRDGTLDVRVFGDFLPRSLLGGLHLWCAILRSLWLALVIVFVQRARFDVLVVDQISMSVPILRWTGAKVRARPEPSLGWGSGGTAAQPRHALCWGAILVQILFYCHFPDKLLTERQSILKRLYRAPLDWLEERTTGAAQAAAGNKR